MVAQFFQLQLDYILFFDGLALLLLAVVCALMRRQQTQPSIPWIWLGLFGLTQGIDKWLDLLAVSLGDGTIFSAIRLGVMILSFGFLFEFGRDGSHKRYVISDKPEDAGTAGAGKGLWIFDL